MGLNIPLLNSCCCLSLRTGVLIIGGVEVFLYTLYFVQILIIIIKYSVQGHIVKFDDLLRDLLLEYTDIINIVFSAILIIGILKENSRFVVAWLLMELTRIIDVVWNSIFSSFMYFHISFFIEELIFIAIQLVFTWIGYSYYITMPKNNKYIL